MKDRAYFKRVGWALLPAGKAGRQLLAAIKEGATIFVEIWSPRNMAQHRKYFAILNNVVEATGRWVSSEHLRRDILLALGRFDQHVNQFTGEVVQVPHSMAVASMPKNEFERLYDDTLKLLTDALGADPEMLIQEAA